VIAPAAILMICIGGLLVLEINDDFVQFFDETVPFRINTDKATELLAGPNHIEAILSNEDGTVFDPAFLAHLSQLANFLRQQDLVANAHSFSDVMDQISSAFTERPLGSIESSDELAQ